MDKLLFTEQKLQHTIKCLAEQINSHHKNDEVVFIGVLNGSFMFFSDLLKEIVLDCEIDFMQVKSYENDTINNIRLLKDIGLEIKNKTVIVVDDIFDTGQTKIFIDNLLKERFPKEIRWCFMLHKGLEVRGSLKKDYIGNCVDEQFYVYGYGMDLSGKKRNLKQIYSK